METIDGRVTALEIQVAALQEATAQGPWYAEDPSGVLDGANTVFVLSRDPGDIFCLFLNGGLQREGAGNDFTRSGRTITMSRAPISLEWVRAVYQVSTGEAPPIVQEIQYQCP